MANIPYSGFNGAIATYTADTCINNISVTANASWITVLNGNSAINGNVQANTTLSSRTATVTVGYKADTTDCSKTFNVTQDARPCNCGDLRVSPTALTWAYSATSANSSSVTISAASCANITSVIIDSGDTTAFTASYNASTKKVTVSPVGQNLGQAPYNAKLRVYYLDDCNKSVVLNQGIMGCSCNDLDFITPTSLFWESNEIGTKIVSYSADSCISDISVTHINTADFDVSLSTTNKEVSVIPRGNNPTTSAKTDTITLSYSAGAVSCPSKTINATQAAHECACEDVTWTTIETNIPSGGTSAQEIASYFAANGCDVTIVSGKAESTTQGQDWIKYVGVSDNKVSVSASTNEDLSNDRYGIVTITYKPSPNSEPCDEIINVSQTSVPCGCEYVNKYIVPIKTEFGSGGTHNQKVLVASGDTHGCGTLSAGTISDMLSGGTFITEPIDGEHYDKVNIYAVVLSGWTGGQSGIDARTCGVTIIYTPKDGTPSCPTDVFSLRQVPGKVSSDDCDDFEVNLESKLIDDCNYRDGYISYGNTKGAVAYLIPKYDDVTPSSNLRLSGSVVSNTGYGTWYLTTYNVYGDVGRFGVGTLYDNVNDNYSARTVTFEVSLVKLRRDIHGEYIWETCKTFPDYHPSVTQSACSKDDCNCGDIELDTSGLSSALSNLSPSSGSVDLDRYVTYNFSAGNFYCSNPIHSAYTLSYSLDPSSASDYVHITYVEQYDGSYHQILTYDANDNGDRDYNLTLSLSVNGTSCTPETISAHQRGLCSCSNFGLKIDGYGTYSHGEYPTITINDEQQDIVFEITGDTSLLSTCINRVIVSYFGETPSWIHTKSTSTSSCTLTFDAYTSGSERTYGGIGIIVQNGGAPCVWDVTVTQTSCQCNPSVYSNLSVEWFDVYSDASRFAKGYEITNSGECFSYQVSYDTSILNVTQEETHDYGYDRIDLYAVTNQNWPSTLSDCEYTDITTTFYTNGEECSSHTFSVRAHKAPYCEQTDAGTLTDYQTTLTSSYDGSEIDIAEITGSNIMDNWCTVLSVTSQSMYDGNTGTVVSCRAVQENNKIMIKAKFHYVQNASPTIDINVNRTYDCDGSISHVTDWSVQVNMV